MIITRLCVNVIEYPQRLLNKILNVKTPQELAENKLELKRPAFFISGWTDEAEPQMKNQGSDSDRALLMETLCLKK